MKNGRAGSSCSSFQVAGESGGTPDDYVLGDILGSDAQRVFALDTIDG